MKATTITKRLCFIVGDDTSAYREKVVEFTWYMGMNWRMRQKSSHAMRDSIRISHPDAKILEVSTKSGNYALGVALSAFNLRLNDIPVENIFQSSKVFNDGGPYTDLLNIPPKDAKKDPRLQTADGIRKLISFNLHGKNFPTEPKSFFYDYLYISALDQNHTLREEIMNYTIFTDIEFNQKIPYSKNQGPFNCQARACAIYVWLKSKGLLADYLKNPGSLKTQIYPSQASQLRLLI